MSETAKVRFPGEWEPHRAVWLAWPAHAELWGALLPAAQAEFLALCRAIADLDSGSGKPRGERLEVLALAGPPSRAAQEALNGLGARVYEARYGDIWLRDTAPLFLNSADEGLLAASYPFNGWGGKYMLEGDDEVAGQVAEHTGCRLVKRDWVLEGGAVDFDGEGTVLTTRQCLLNRNRNPGLSVSDIESRLRREFGVETVLWLDEGLVGDHTDGHIDNLARFAGPGRVVCQDPAGREDPNREILEATARALEAMSDAGGRKLEVIRIPSPGRVVDQEGEVMAASHVNFYLSNTRVIVPQYEGTVTGGEAITRLTQLFPGRGVVGLPAWAILHGGGSFHCITQQVPV